MRRPYAYLRKSVVEKNKRLLSPEVQQSEVRKLAEHKDDTDLVWLSDIGRSGKNTKRPGYQELIAAIKDDKVKALYAYSLSRLNRSVGDYSDLVNLCVEHRVPIRLVHEGEQDFATPSGRFTSTILAAAAQMQRELDSERQKDNIRVKVANGEHHGAHAYGHYEWESLQAVEDAFEVTGSINGAARQLEAWGVPTRQGDPWAPSSVRRILHSQAPRAIPAGQVARAKAAPPYKLARLLACHCGKTMTGTRGRGYIRYRCHESVVDGHGTASIAEASIIDWIKAEAARFDRARILEAEVPDAERAALDDRLAKLSRQHEMGLLTDAQLMERVRGIQDALEGLHGRVRASELPDSIDWEQDDVRAINAVLRAYWDHVQLGPDLQPIRAIWRFDPEAAT